MTSTHALRCLIPTLALIVSACTAPEPASPTESAPPAAKEHAAAKPAAPTAAPLPLPAAGADKIAEYPGLHNVVAYGDGLYSGSVPHGDEGFESLERMGIKTVISVDGSVPDLEKAQAHGLRYVHLPIGYDGIDEKRTLEIARAVEDLPGPIFIHCHHGKHRSAGAAGAAVVTLGRLTPDQVKARMKVSGTAEDYTGLFACVAMATPVDAKRRISTASNAFPSVSPPDGYVAAMVVVDEANDALKAIEKAGWKTPADHPDLVPAAEAGRLADSLRAAAESDETKTHAAELRQWLDDAVVKAQALEEGLVAKLSADELSKRMKAVAQSCKSCHAKYRD